MGIQWATPQPEVDSLELTMHRYIDGGWFGKTAIGDNTDPLTATELIVPSIQTLNNDNTWATLDPASYTTDYMTVMQTPTAHQQAFPTATFTFNTALTDVTAIRFIGEAGGTGGNAGRGFIGIRELEVSGEGVYLPTPTNLVTSDYTDTSFKLTWDTVADATGYTVTLATNANLTTGAVTLPSGGVTTDNYMTFDGLTGNTVYYYGVKAHKNDISSFNATGSRKTSRNVGTTGNATYFLTPTWNNSFYPNALNLITFKTIDAGLNIDNPVRSGNSYYQDQTAHVASVTAGSTFKLNLQTVEKFSVGKVWIDWNNDGKFDEAIVTEFKAGTKNEVAGYFKHVDAAGWAVVDDIKEFDSETNNSIVTISVPSTFDQGVTFPIETRMRVATVNTKNVGNPDNLKTEGFTGNAHMQDYVLKIYDAGADVEIMAYEPLSGFELERNTTTLEAVKALLPNTVTIFGSGGLTRSVTDWTSSDYDQSKSGSYTFTAVLDVVPAGYTDATPAVEATVQVAVYHEDTLFYDFETGSTELNSHWAVRNDILNGSNLSTAIKADGYSSALCTKGTSWDNGIGVIESPVYTLSEGAVSFGFAGNSDFSAYDYETSEKIATSGTNKIVTTVPESGSFDLSAYVGKKVYFRITDSQSSNWGYKIVDDFKIAATVNDSLEVLLPVNNLTASGQSKDGFTLNWDKVESAENYTVTISTNSDLSAPVQTHTVTQGDNPEKVVTGLTHNTTYYFGVRANATGGSTLNTTGSTKTHYSTGSTGDAEYTLSETWSSNSRWVTNSLTTTGAAVNIDNQTPSGTAFYVDQTAHAVTAVEGSSFVITINGEDAWHGGKVWVDWNNDGLFEDTTMAEYATDKKEVAGYFRSTTASNNHWDPATVPYYDTNEPFAKVWL